MQLHDYISTTIVSVLNGLKTADVNLRDQKLGQIWTSDFKTLAHDLVTVRLVKGENPKHPKKSIPVILFDYDVNIVVAEAKTSGSETTIESGGKLLQVLSVKGKVDGKSSKDHSERVAHNLKFTIPVAITMSDEQAT